MEALFRNECCFCLSVSKMSPKKATGVKSMNTELLGEHNCCFACIFSKIFEFDSQYKAPLSFLELSIYYLVHAYIHAGKHALDGAENALTAMIL